jgi:hypothetical protein
MPKSSYQRKSAYFLCIERGTYKIDLQIGKVYRTAPPEKNDPESMLRLVDDSGEDYLSSGLVRSPRSSTKSQESLGRSRRVKGPIIQSAVYTTADTQAHKLIHFRNPRKV